MVCDIHRRRSQDLKIARDYRVLLNGKDVSNSVFYIDTRRKIVGKYLHDEKGLAFVLPNSNMVAVEWLRERSLRLVRKTA